MEFASARQWLKQDPDPVTRAELEKLLAAGDSAAIDERFAGRLEFGTAGLRGVLGAGPMRMNRLVVQQTSAGLCRYLEATVDGARDRGVVVGYDARRMSREFAEDTAAVLLAAGYRVYLTTDVVPTPLVAYAVLAERAAAGVMVTASHNPPQYNGYKVYWQNGAQIIPPHDGGIAQAIGEIAKQDRIELANLDAARRDGRLVDLGDEMNERYLQGVADLAVQPNDGDLSNIVVAYTPLHGVGAKFVEAALARQAGCTLHIEPGQAAPDGAFPTVDFPNPEEPGAMDRVTALGTEVGADVIVANDPDADRLAVALPEGDGYQMLTGDQVGALLADYLLSEGPQDKRLVATTLVSSQLLGHMAQALGVDYRVTLTGFKWIGNAALDYSEVEGGRFVFGYEEALGYSVGELVRDKDGVSAVALICEMVAWAAKRGESLRQRLDDIYRRHGLYLTQQKSIVVDGAAGMHSISSAMKTMRDTPPEQIGGYGVEQSHDLAQGALGLPSSNVLVFQLEGGRRVIVRPSGTEPKLKCYYEVREEVGEAEAVTDALARAQLQLSDLVKAHQKTVQACF